MNTDFKSETHANAAISFLGITVHPLKMAELNSLLAEAIERDEKIVVANHNLHSLYLFLKNAKVREFYRHAQWVHIDGMPIVAMARLYGHEVPREARVTYADWTYSIAKQAAEKGWRVFYLGSAAGVAEAGAEILRSRFPGLQIRTMHGFFNASAKGAENEGVLRQIANYSPNVLMVGMGMPRQELWIQENLSSLRANTILPSGAAMDYVAGAVPTPPRWAGKMGLEWAFRLGAEPRRLWYRYLVEPWTIVGAVIRDLFIKRFTGRSVTLNEE